MPASASAASAAAAETSSHAHEICAPGAAWNGATARAPSITGSTHQVVGGPNPRATTMPSSAATPSTTTPMSRPPQPATWQTVAEWTPHAPSSKEISRPPALDAAAAP
jgi:hypothetical protein